MCILKHVWTQTCSIMLSQNTPPNVYLWIATLDYRLFRPQICSCNLPRWSHMPLCPLTWLSTCLRLNCLRTPNFKTTYKLAFTHVGMYQCKFTCFTFINIWGSIKSINFTASSNESMVGSLSFKISVRSRSASNGVSSGGLDARRLNNWKI